jgi:hypothetical protein
LFMPLGRYFAYIGGVLLALLFLIDWFLPQPGVDPDHSDVDRSIIRIHSMHKWPSAVVYDTSQPTIVPPAPAVTAEAPVASAPREALAMAPKPDPAPAAAPAATSKHVTRRVRVARASAARIASYERPSYEQPSHEMFGFRPAFQFPAGW